MYFYFYISMNIKVFHMYSQSPYDPYILIWFWKVSVQPKRLVNVLVWLPSVSLSIERSHSPENLLVISCSPTLAYFCSDTEHTDQSWYAIMLYVSVICLERKMNTLYLISY